MYTVSGRTPTSRKHVHLTALFGPARDADHPKIAHGDREYLAQVRRQGDEVGFSLSTPPLQIRKGKEA